MQSRISSLFVCKHYYLYGFMSMHLPTAVCVCVCVCTMEREGESGYTEG